MDDQALKDYFDFDESDLAANRAGEYSEKKTEICRGISGSPDGWTAPGCAHGCLGLHSSRSLLKKSHSKIDILSKVTDLSLKFLAKS